MRRTRVNHGIESNLLRLAWSQVRATSSPIRSYVMDKFFDKSDALIDFIVRHHLPFFVRSVVILKRIPYNAVTATKKTDKTRGTILWYDAPFASQQTLDEVTALVSKFYFPIPICSKIRGKSLVDFKRKE